MDSSFWFDTIKLEWVVVNSLFVVAPIVYGGFVFVPCRAIILLRKRELVALLKCLPAVLWLLVLLVSSSLCRGLVCSI